VLDGATLTELRAFVASSEWQCAVTMPEHPHEYTLRRRAPDPSRFQWFVLFIRVHGYERRFQGRPYRYLDLDGWSYWTMGAPLHQTILINRARIAGSDASS
jgi:hypothetical protein